MLFWTDDEAFNSTKLLNDFPIGASTRPSYETSIGIFAVVDDDIDIDIDMDDDDDDDDDNDDDDDDDDEMGERDMEVLLSAVWSKVRTFLPDW